MFTIFLRRMKWKEEYEINGEDKRVGCLWLLQGTTPNIIWPDHESSEDNQCSGRYSNQILPNTTRMYPSFRWGYHVQIFIETRGRWRPVYCCYDTGTMHGAKWKQESTVLVRPCCYNLRYNYTQCFYHCLKYFKEALNYNLKKIHGIPNNAPNW